MKIGLSGFLTDDGIGIEELAPLAEDRGFESLFLAEHSHIPAVRESELAPGDGELPEEYWRTLDPFAALAAAAQVTSELRLGTGICLVVQRDPIHTAKSVATLDHLSGGRFLFGVGAGWNREEMRNHGTDPGRRFALMRERIAAMKEIWTKPEATFTGEFVSFERILAYPKPVQRPHPPILVAGSGPRALDRVIAYGDGWLPESSAALPRIRELQERARSGGRPDGLPVTIFSSQVDELEAFKRAGVSRALFSLPPRDAVATRRRIDELALGLGLG